MNPASITKAARASRAKADGMNGKGFWFGGIPVRSNPRPPPGQSVVYFLLDADHRLVYIGSSGKFCDRLRVHRKTKDFAYWWAVPMASRKIAYRVEAALIATHRPLLNAC